MRGCQALLRSLDDIYRITIRIGKVTLAAAKSITLVSVKMLWWQLKNLDSPTPLFNLVRFGFAAVWAVLVNWKSILTSPLRYREAKKLSKERGTEWSKRRYAISRLVKSKQRKVAENKEWQYVERYESQDGDEVEKIDASGFGNGR